MNQIGDLLTRIMNGGRSKLLYIKVPFSTLRQDFLKFLYRNGYIRGYYVSVNIFYIFLKYQNGVHAISNIKQISRPGCRKYIKWVELSKERPLTTMVLTTPKGICSAKEARLQHLGGELLCLIQ